MQTFIVAYTVVWLAILAYGAWLAASNTRTSKRVRRLSLDAEEEPGCDIPQQSAA
jgi:CcmD family protein